MKTDRAGGWFATFTPNAVGDHIVIVATPEKTVAVTVHGDDGRADTLGSLMDDEPEEEKA